MKVAVVMGRKGTLRYDEEAFLACLMLLGCDIEIVTPTGRMGGASAQRVFIDEIGAMP